MVRSLRLLTLALVLGVLACVSFVQGPVPPPLESVLEVRIVELRGDGAPLRSITDPERIREIVDSHAFSPEGWEEPWSTDFRPHHQVELVTRDGARTRYWLGTFSDPPRPPCFWLCSGWWLAASDEHGVLDVSRYKSLASSFDLFFVGGLFYGCRGLPGCRE